MTEPRADFDYLTLGERKRYESGDWIVPHGSPCGCVAHEHAAALRRSRRVQWLRLAEEPRT